MKMSLNAVLSTVRETKNEKTGASDFYGEFLFMGGSFNLKLDSSSFSELSQMRGNSVEIEVSLRPRSVVLFNRPQTLFDPHSFLGLVKPRANLPKLEDSEPVKPEPAKPKIFGR